jgi:hypothetical protein
MTSLLAKGKEFKWT